jgi:hypothetical protein
MVPPAEQVTRVRAEGMREPHLGPVRRHDPASFDLRDGLLGDADVAGQLILRHRKVLAAQPYC